MPVHPRARGEHLPPRAGDVMIPGSSPRTRGTQRRTGRGGSPPRFIPAHAGNTRTTTLRSRRTPVHPRARGEHPRAPWTSAVRCGSSPRTRGTPEATKRYVGRLRFIPAHAGNTAPPAAARPIPPVHPRARGEHARRMRRIRRSVGSSPRTRGTQPAARPLDGLHRFIPAHAGNTRGSAPRWNSWAVHPRARGEHRMKAAQSSGLTGSSPRTRGTRGARRPAPARVRFIPAHAGNTVADLPLLRHPAVHPRARGEHRTSEEEFWEATGSSPRTRGTHHFPHRGKGPFRFIPAHAGNTAAWSTSHQGHAVHPRARGEHELRCLAHYLSAGSSPRTRGTP